MPQLRAKARKLKLEKDISLIIIDYLQLMSGSAKNIASRQQEISEIFIFLNYISFVMEMVSGIIV